MPESNQTSQVDTEVLLSMDEMAIAQANLRFALENCPLEGGIILEDGTASSEQSVRTLLKKLESARATQVKLADLAGDDIRLLKAIAEYAVQECSIEGEIILDSGRMITKDDIRALKEKFRRLPQVAVTKNRALSAIDLLEEEHRLILRVIKLLPKLSENIKKGAIDEGVLSDIVEFFTKFTDEFHHAKEEDQFFPALQRHGVSSKGCPIGALRLEHQQGGSLAKGLNGAIERYREGNAEETKTILELLKNVEELYTNHIWKEDYLLFPMSAKVLSDQDLRTLAKDFAETLGKFGSGFLEQYEALVESLEKSVERSLTQAAAPREPVMSF